MSDSRRDFLKRSGLLGAGMLAGSGIVSAQHQGHMHPEPPQTPPKKEEMPAKNEMPAKKPAARQVTTTAEARANALVETPDVPRLPFTLDNGVKVFHLSADVVKTQLLSVMIEMTGWGYNGGVPGPTIEVNEGVRLRIMLHNNLQEATSIHW